jgi:Serine aminopeptidase, S33
VQSSEKRVVVLCHGFASHRDGFHFPGIAQSLAKRNIGSLRFDFAGNGDSEGTFQFGNYADEAQDIRAAVLFLRSKDYTVVGIVGAHTPHQITGPPHMHARKSCTLAPVHIATRCLCSMVLESMRRHHAPRSSQRTGARHGPACPVVTLMGRAAGHSKGANSALVYASVYDDVPNVVNVAGRFDLKRGLTERFGNDVLARLNNEKQIVLEDTRDDGIVIEWTLTKWSYQDRLNTDMQARTACAGFVASHAVCAHLTQ